MTAGAGSGAGMTGEQRRLARHALGLGGDRRASYRNSFVATLQTREHGIWLGMVDAGLAEGCEWGRGTELFHLTRAGAELALDPGESLDPVDFPPPGAPR